MPNRIKREGYLRSRKLAIASADAEVLWNRLVNVVDDFGRYDADPTILRAAAWPKSYHRYTDDQVARWLDELECCLHLIVRYRVGKDCFLLFLNTDPPRAKKSKWPAPPPELAERVRAWSVDGPPETCPHRGTNGAPAASTDAPEGIAPACDHLHADANTLQASARICSRIRSSDSYSESNAESKKQNPPAPDGAFAFVRDHPPRGSPGIDSEFLEFQALYPHPANDPSKPAREKYRSARRRGVAREAILDGLKAELEERALLESRRAFVPSMPMMKTWLGQARWEDALRKKAARAEIEVAERVARERSNQERWREWIAKCAFVRHHQGRGEFLRLTSEYSDEERRLLEAELDQEAAKYGWKDGEQTAGGAG